MFTFGRRRRLQAGLDQALRDYLTEASQEANNAVRPLLHLERSLHHGSYTIGLMDGDTPVALEVGESNIASIKPGPPSLLMHVPLENPSTLDKIIRHFYEVSEAVESDDHRAWIAIALNAKLFITTPHPGLDYLWPADTHIASMAERYFEE